MGDPLYHVPAGAPSKPMRAAIVTLMFLLLAAVASANANDTCMDDLDACPYADPDNLDYERSVEVCPGTWISKNNWGEHSPFRPGGWHILNRYGCHIQWHGTVQEAEEAAAARCSRTRPPLGGEWWGNPVPPEVR